MSPFVHSLPLTLLLILNRLMLLAAAYSFNFTLHIWQKSFSCPFLKLLLSPHFTFFCSIPKRHQGRFKKNGMRGWYEVFKLEICSIGHTLFAN